MKTFFLMLGVASLATYAIAANTSRKPASGGGGNEFFCGPQAIAAAQVLAIVNRSNANSPGSIFSKDRITYEVPLSNGGTDIQRYDVLTSGDANCVIYSVSLKK
jgi:hypothetical protein